MAATFHAYQVGIFQTMDGWLDARIATTCDNNAAALDELIASNTQSRADAVAEADKQLEQGQSILGEVDETAEDF
jgi:hypothetical protein